MIRSRAKNVTDVAYFLCHYMNLYHNLLDGYQLPDYVVPEWFQEKNPRAAFPPDLTAFPKDEWARAQNLILLRKWLYWLTRFSWMDVTDRSAMDMAGLLYDEKSLEGFTEFDEDED